MTSSPMMYALAGALLFVIGAVGVIVHTHLLRKVLAFNVMGSGSFLVLIGLAQRDRSLDYLPHAMVLTGIVVSVAASALALALSRRLFNLTGAMHLPDKGGR